MQPITAVIDSQEDLQICTSGLPISGRVSTKILQGSLPENLGWSLAKIGETIRNPESVSMKILVRILNQHRKSSKTSWLFYAIKNFRSQLMTHHMRTVCGYHANCADGFGAAWAVRNAVRCDSYEPCNYGMSLPDSFIGADVILVDFSYKRADMILLSESCKSVLVLDHHASAERELKNLPSNIKCVFDMDRSGARIAWDYFNEGDPPSLLLHIEDRDLWRFALPYTREIQSALFSHAYDFSVWDELMSRDARELISDGIAIERKAQKDLRELLAATTRRMLIAGIDVPVANLPYTMASEAGNIMANGEPFAATYFDTPTCRQ